MQTPRIYLDHAATTPLLAEARAVMLPWLDSGNASSLYLEGRRAKNAIDSARESVSNALSCLFAEVLFTSGGTEGAVMAILGAALANEDLRRTKILMSAAEHHAVLNTADALGRLGYRVEHIAVDQFARVDMERLRQQMGDDVLLVSVMHANNEFGTVNDLDAIVPIVHAHGALFHTDAVQSFLTDYHINPSDLKIDLLTVSGHKVHGPKGVGAIYLRAGVKIKPIMAGGGQEREMRGGTENVAAIAGFGAAVSAVPREISSAPRDHFLANISGIPSVNGANHGPILNGHAHVRFPGIQAETMLIRLDLMGLSASSGAACSSGSIEPSHVMLAAGFSGIEAREGVRFTFGRCSTLEIAKSAAEIVERAVAAIRSA